MDFAVLAVHLFFYLKEISRVPVWHKSDENLQVVSAEEGKKSILRSPPFPFSWQCLIPAHGGGLFACP